MGNEDTLFLISGLTLVVALIAAWYSYRSDRRKSGIEVQGSYSVVSSVASSDKYIGRILLQNLKDRAVVVFAIYLEIGHGHYLEIEEFRDQPLVLGPFSAFQKEYEPIDFYMSGPYRIAMDRALDATKHARRRLVLSTAQGRYKIDTAAIPWDPIRDFFKNNLTNIVRPMRSQFRDKSYGSGTKYVVILTADGGEEEIIPIYPRDHEVRKFRDFRLTFESLQSRDALEVFLLERAVAGDLRCSDLAVFDLEEWRKTAYEHCGRRVVDARLHGWFTYNVLGWLLTRWNDFALWRRNRENRQKNRETLDAKARSESTDEQTSRG